MNHFLFGLAILAFIALVLLAAGAIQHWENADLRRANKRTRFHKCNRSGCWELTATDVCPMHERRRTYEARTSK